MCPLLLHWWPDIALSRRGSQQCRNRLLTPLPSSVLVLDCLGLPARRGLPWVNLLEASLASNEPHLEGLKSGPGIPPPLELVMSLVLLCDPAERVANRASRSLNGQTANISVPIRPWAPGLFLKRILADGSERRLLPGHWLEWALGGGQAQATDARWLRAVAKPPSLKWWQRWHSGSS